jgi:hypothetical protein
MRTWLASLACLVVVVALSACGGSGTPSPAAPEVETHTPAAPPKTPPRAIDTSARETAPPVSPAPAETPVSTAGAPKIFSPMPEYDYGEWDNEEKVEHDFVIKNIGEGTLNIKQVRTSCGCTVAQPKKNVLAPGEETTVNAVLNLKGRQGSQVKTITVASDDPETPIYQLRMKGTAIAAIAVDPERVNFGKIESDEIPPQTVKIFTDREEVNFKIMSVEATSVPELEPDVLKTDLKVIEPGKSYELTLSFAKMPPTGILNGRVMIRTDDTKRPMLIVFFNAQMVGDLMISPDRITVTHSANPDQRANMAMRITTGRIKEFTLLEVKPPFDDINVEVQQLRDGDYLLRVNNIPCDDSIEGKELVLVTDIPGKTNIGVPFELRRPRVLPGGPGANIVRPQPVVKPAATPPKEN